MSILSVVVLGPNKVGQELEIHRRNRYDPFHLENTFGTKWKESFEELKQACEVTKMNCRIVLFSAVVLVCQLGAVSNAQPFSVTAPGISIPDNSIQIVPMFLPAGLDRIEQLEIEINGLSHAQPADLDCYLINPFGMTAELMSDRGGALAIAGVDLTFADGAAGVPSQDGPIVSGLYRPEGLHLGTDGILW